MTLTKTVVADNLVRVREQIAEASRRSGRSADAVTLVAVTKAFPLEVVAEAYKAGLRDFGENRVQEAEAKIRRAHAFAPHARWHLIGHLQRNKVQAALECFLLVHSVDSFRLAHEISRRCTAGRRNMTVLLEVNVSGEGSKGGFRLGQDHSAFWREAEQIRAQPGVQVRGLMTMAPYSTRAEDARPYFARLRELRDELAARTGGEESPWQHLSMGMSGDFVVAVEEGATILRIGTAIFGERAAPP